MLTLVGGGWGLIRNLLDDQRLAQLVVAHATKYLPTSELKVERVDFEPLSDKIRLNRIEINQEAQRGRVETLRFPWIEVLHNPKALLEGHFQPIKVSLAQPRLRLARQQDGRWNVQTLLADPWPGMPMKVWPEIEIQGGVVELTDASGVIGLLDNAQVVIKRVSRQSPDLMSYQIAARGRVVDSIELHGQFDKSNGAVVISGIIRGLKLSESLQNCLPSDLRMAFRRSRLEGGRLDLEIVRLERPPIWGPTKAQPPGKPGDKASLNLNPIQGPWRYELTARLREASLREDPAPFRLTDVTADLQLKTGWGRLDASGWRGPTRVRLTGEFGIDLTAPEPTFEDFKFDLNVIDLSLDDSLRRWITRLGFGPVWDEWLEASKDGVSKAPLRYAQLIGREQAANDRGAAVENGLEEFQLGVAGQAAGSRGRVNLTAHLSRANAQEPMKSKAQVVCLGVNVIPFDFPYPFTNVVGRLDWDSEPNELKIDVKTLVGGRPASARGIVRNPGPDAFAEIDLHAESAPMDQTLLNALAPDIRQAVEEFHPTGSAEVWSRIERRPADAHHPLPRLDVTTELMLTDRCAVKWDGLPYPVSNLTGRLVLTPTVWRFEDMRGTNAQTVVEGSGVVRKLGPGLRDLESDIQLVARNLAFDPQLRAALPPEWQQTWATLNPSGSCDVAARVRTRPGKDHFQFVVRPRPETRIELELPPIPGAPQGHDQPIRFPAMENIRGTFSFDDGEVVMTGVGFEFRGAPTRVERGRVRLEPNGAFDLEAFDLSIANLRLDSGLRKLMPPLMAKAAQRFKDDPIALMRGHLRIGWNGQPGQPATVAWNQGLVLLDGNAIETGLPIQHIQGQIDRLSGDFDGRTLRARGVLDLDSVNIGGLQVTAIRAPWQVQGGQAELPDFSARLLGGRLGGRASTTLEENPRYHLEMRLQDADLSELALNLPGTEGYRGRLAAEIVTDGVGADRRGLSGRGWARVVEGDLGRLPAYLALVKFLKLNLNRINATAFDDASVRFRIAEGVASLDRIVLQGDAFSLEGGGYLSPRNELDLRLKLLLGRDRQFHVPVVSDLVREATGQLFIIRVQGRPTAPSYRLEALPGASELLRDSLGGLPQPGVRR